MKKGEGSRGEVSWMKKGEGSRGGWGEMDEEGGGE